MPVRCPRSWSAWRVSTGRRGRFSSTPCAGARSGGRPGPPRPINLVHRDDCVGILRHLLELEDPAPLYLGVDSEPVVRDELLDWLAERLGIPPPERGAAEPDVRRGRGSKRCSNARLLASGYRLRRPTFRDGYADLLGTE